MFKIFNTGDVSGTFLGEIYRWKKDDKSSLYNAAELINGPDIDKNQIQKAVEENYRSFW